MSGGDAPATSTPSPTLNRLDPIFAVAGAVLLLAGTALLPMTADPNDAIAAFTEYAAAPHWVASHLMQLAGVALIVGALVLVARRLGEGPGREWAALATAAAIASLAVAVVLQAVDGVALDRMVLRWAAATGQDKSALFDAAFAVRQIEVGIAAMTGLLFGVTAILFGVAMMIGPVFPPWLAMIAIGGGATTASGGVGIANTGFSAPAMAIKFPETCC